jgi:uncharacterized protein
MLGWPGAQRRAQTPTTLNPILQASHSVMKNQASAPATAPPSAGAASAAPRDARRVQTRRSGVHGKGVFALQPLAAGETVLEYTGEVISWPEALRRHPHDPDQPNHTFYFHLDEKHVIDGNVGGNSSRWINHSCKPNCEAEDDEGRVFIKTLRNIDAGEELFFDYGLIIDARHTKKLLADYPCWCGAKKCRGTLLAPKEKAVKSKAAKSPADKPSKASRGK